MITLPKQKAQCRSAFITLMVLVLALLGSSTGCGLDDLQSIEASPEEADILIQGNIDNPNFIIIDLRTPGEYAGGHIENAINVNFFSSTFTTNIDALDKDKTYLIHCATGHRSALASSTMTDLGFLTIYNLSGGLNRWIAEGYPII